MVRIKGFRDIVTHSSLSRSRRKTARSRVGFRSTDDWTGEVERHLVVKAKPFNCPRPIHGWVWRSAIRLLLSFLEKELVEVGQFIQEGIPINPEEIPDLQNRISRLRKILSQ